MLKLPLFIIAIVAVALIGWVVYRHYSISWDEAKLLINNCKVASVTERHGNYLSLRLKGGSFRRANYDENELRGMLQPTSQRCRYSIDWAIE